jgi:CheY-like chemotaxis protein
LTGGNVFVAAGSEPGPLVAARLPEIDEPVAVIFIAAGGAVPHRDQFRLPRDYSVIDTSTVEAAIALSQGHRLDLVILDLGPSAAEGLDTLRQLRADPRLGRAPLVLVGAFEDMGVLRQGLQIGARDYLIRGETTPALVARRVRSWLDDPAAQVLLRRAFGPSRKTPAPALRTPVPAAQTGMAKFYGASLIGLLVLLLKETRFVVMGRDTKRK